MTLTLRQHKIAALKLTRDYIQSRAYTLGCDKGICLLLSRYKHNYTAVNSLKGYIRRALTGRHLFLNSWVRQNSKLEYWPNSDDPRMVATRVAWLDWMIQCLEEDEANGK